MATGATGTTVGGDSRRVALAVTFVDVLGCNAVANNVIDGALVCTPGEVKYGSL